MHLSILILIIMYLGTLFIKMAHMKITTLYRITGTNLLSFLFIFTFTVLFTSCVGFAEDRTYHDIYLNNTSLLSIVACLNIDSLDVNKGSYYHDNRLPNTPRYLVEINPKTEDHFEAWMGPWKKYYKNYNYIHVYIISKSTINNYSWQIIAEQGLFLVRYDLTKDDINRLETVGNEGLSTYISFPPSERMKNIHMWPPYEEVIAKYNE